MSLILSGNSLMSFFAVFMVIWGVGCALPMQNVKLFVVLLRKLFIYIVKIVIIDNIIHLGGAAFHAMWSSALAMLT